MPVPPDEDLGKLADEHDDLSDGQLAERIAAHPDADVLLALWRRITGHKREDHREDQAPAADPPQPPAWS